MSIGTDNLLAKLQASASAAAKVRQAAKDAAASAYQEQADAQAGNEADKQGGK